MSRYFRVRREWADGHLEFEVGVGLRYRTPRWGTLGVGWNLNGLDGPNEITLYLGPCQGWIALSIWRRSGAERAL